MAVGAPDAVAQVPATQPRANATLTRPDIKRTMREARDGLPSQGLRDRHPVAHATAWSSRNFAGRAEALELLGLARERSGQLAHAKAEYEEYLRRYPAGEAAARTRKRLRALTFAASPASRKRSAAAGESPWKVYGGWSQVYRRDDASFDTGTASADRTTQNAILTDVALTARRRGERFDFASRASAGYGLDLLQDGPGDQSRVTTLFAEVHDRELDWTVRGGRQSGGLGGVLGTFDGLYAGYQLRPRLQLNAHVGYPVETHARRTIDRPPLLRPVGRCRHVRRRLGRLRVRGVAGVFRD